MQPVGATNQRLRVPAPLDVFLESVAGLLQGGREFVIDPQEGLGGAFSHLAFRGSVA